MADTNATIHGAGLPFNEEDDNVRCGAHPKPPPPPAHPPPHGDWVVVLNIVFPERRRLNRTERVRLGSAFGRRRRRAKYAQEERAWGAGSRDSTDDGDGGNARASDGGDGGAGSADGVNAGCDDSESSNDGQGEDPAG